MSYQRSSALDATQEDVKPKINEGQFVFPEEDQEKIQERLNTYLTKEDISSRAAFNGSKVSYLEGWKTFQIANEIFGFNGWSTSILNTSVDYLDVIDGRFSVGISTVIRVTLKDGSYHEDIGYGMMENSKSKGAAFEKAKKESVTDAVKRALRYFGNSLGNCLYDKGFLKASSKPTPSVSTGSNGAPVLVNGFGNLANNRPRPSPMGLSSNIAPMSNMARPGPHNSNSLISSTSHGTYPSSNERLTQFTSNQVSGVQAGSSGVNQALISPSNPMPSSNPQANPTPHGAYTNNNGRPTQFTSNQGPGVQAGTSGANQSLPSPSNPISSSNPLANPAPHGAYTNSNGRPTHAISNHGPGAQTAGAGFNQIHPPSSNHLNSRDSGAKPICVEQSSVREDSFDFDLHDESFSQCGLVGLAQPNSGTLNHVQTDTRQNESLSSTSSGFGPNQSEKSNRNPSVASIQMSTSFTTANRLANVNSSSSPASQQNGGTPIENQYSGNAPNLKRHRGL